jgi:D-alanyl-D-alanine carboxypeptidase
MKLSARSHVALLALALTGAIAAPMTPPVPVRFPTVPGMEVVVVKHGQIVTDAAYGVKNVDTQQPVDIHTHFEIGSITKQFTAAAILQLKEHGKLSLDDPLGKYIPQYTNGRRVTLRQLLMQVSGIPNYTSTRSFLSLIVLRGKTVVLKHPGTFPEILALIRNKPLEFKPGTKFRYSNTNYVLLGRIVERVSGMPWSEYIARNIFVPAAMHESSFMEDETRIPDMATGYMTFQGKVRPAGGARGTFNGWADGAGAIVSTATDLAKWDAALFGGKIIRQADLRLMTTPGPLPAFGQHAHYAFGWVVDTHDGQPRIWHNGGTLGFTATNDLYPKLGETIITLVNSTVGNSDAVADAYFSALHPQLAAMERRAVPGEDPAITARAKAIFLQFVSGTLDRKQLSVQMNQAMTPAVVAEAKTQFSALGHARSWIYRGKHPAKAGTRYEYRVSFSSGVTTVYMTVDAAGKIAGYLVSPN